MTATAVVDKAQQLAAAGQHAEVVEYLGQRSGRELADSPSLALLYGTAQARLGRHEEGQRWLEVALNQARRRDEQAVERHALNARGAVAMVSGRIDEAAEYFTRALMAASRDGDHATTGRCSNNLGIIANLRGRHAEAIGSWELALAAFERAGIPRGVVECRHNLGITYREQGLSERALAEANHAVSLAESTGDRTLGALALRGRAEIRLATGELEPARVDLAHARELRRGLLDTVGEAEDLRVEALVQATSGDARAAEGTLREVIARAESHGRLLLLAEALRDLSGMLCRAGRNAEAQAAALKARALFERLGAEREIRNLVSQDWDADFAAKLRGSLAPLHAAQRLVDSGRYLEALSYLAARSPEEFQQFPMLSLLSGIAHSRLGRLDLGQHWALVAQVRARTLGDRALEIRALNVCGAIALERGGIDQATYFFTRAEEEATEDDDMASVGRCANNLGIIASMQGDYNRAVTAYTRAIGAYRRARHDRGVAEAQHNLAITYREQGQLHQAMQTAEAAVRDAERLGDRALHAQALAGLAEIHVFRGEPELAIQEAERALAVHRDLQDAVLEAEDLRILAVAIGVAGKTDVAQDMLHDVIHRASGHGRPLLVAIAQRDLARLLAGDGDAAAATEVAQQARATLHRLGAKVEIAKLDAWFETQNAELTACAAAPSRTRDRLVPLPSTIPPGGPRARPESRAQ